MLSVRVSLSGLRFRVGLRPATLCLSEGLRGAGSSLLGCSIRLSELGLRSRPFGYCSVRNVEA